MAIKTSCVFAILAAISTMSASAAGITYSGIQDIVLQGVVNSNQILNLELAGVASPTDTLQLEISDFPGLGDPYGGTNGILAGTAEVALAFGSYPLADPLDFGDPYPSNPQFGSGGTILYGFGYGPADGDFYYPLASESSDLTGWIQLLIQNSNAPNESITAVDWAITDVPGQHLAMGVGGTPEPASWVLVTSALALGFMVLLLRLRGKSAGLEGQIQNWIQ